MGEAFSAPKFFQNASLPKILRADMFNIQQPVAPPLSDELFVGKTVLVTGANTGLDFSASRTFLRLGASRLILAVRSLSNGEAARTQLLSGIEIQQRNPHATIEILHLDLEDYSSVMSCTDKLRTFCGGVRDSALENGKGLDVMVLNAGASIFNYQRTKDGHETMMQVNYLSHALFAMSLVPLLMATARQKGSPAHITWVGSDRYKDHSLNGINAQLVEKEINGQGEILHHFDDAKNWNKWGRYNDTKCFAALFVCELAERVPPKAINVNMCCPGMVNTGITDHLPLVLRVLVLLIMAIQAISREQAGWLVVRAVQGVNIEDRGHGGYLNDGAVEP